MIYSKSEACKYLKNSKIFLETEDIAKKVYDKLEECGIKYHPLFDEKTPKSHEINEDSSVIVIFDMFWTKVVTLSALTKLNFKTLSATDVINIEIVEYMLNPSKFYSKYSVHERVETPIGIGIVESISKDENGEITYKVNSGHIIDIYYEDELSYPKHVINKDDIVNIKNEKIKSKIGLVKSIDNNTGLLLLTTAEGNLWIKENDVSKYIEHFYPFQSVLVRNDGGEPWQCAYYSHVVFTDSKLKYCCNTSLWNQCISYDGNEDLIGKCKHK